ncbi:MAG: OmpA family protein [Saprospiraceae bacterium]|nr:OmpA family protein [Saprospiraceae bacterium]
MKFIRIGLSILSILLVASSIIAQGVVKRSDLDKKTLKIYKNAIAEGRGKKYDKSLKLFAKVLKKYPTFLDARLRKAGMLHNQKKYESSANEFKKAIELDPEYDPQMYFSLAIVQRDLDRYDLAAESFQQYINRASKSNRKERAIEYRDQALFIHKAKENPVPFNPEKMDGGISSSYSEYVPLMNIEGNQMVFTRKVNGQEDFYSAHIENGEVVNVKELTSLNTPLNEGVHTLSADGNTLIFTACERRKTGIGSCDLYYSFRKGENWSIPSNMGKIINSISWDGQPSLSSDGKRLFFSSGRQDGYGGNDIWMSTRTDTSGWTLPIVLPDEINTTGNEESPFIHPDGHTLYFRSDKHIGMGSFDIFYSRYVDSTKMWSKPTNIGYPINTEGNEGAFSVSLDGRKAFYTSDMAYLNDKSNANLDIYTFDLYEDARPMATTFIKAQIIDAITKEPLVANYSIVPLQKKLNKVSGKSDVSGSMISSLPTNFNYAFFVEKEGYLLYSESFRLEGIQYATDPYILKIELFPVPKATSSNLNIAKPIVLNNIFFESGLAELKKESDIELFRLSENLKENATVQIEIHGHTDNVGSKVANLKLSEKRAEAVAQALIQLGVSSDRISFKGFGEDKPVDTNDTEEGRKNNRRTEFVIK